MQNVQNHAQTLLSEPTANPDLEKLERVEESFKTLNVAAQPRLDFLRKSSVRKIAGCQVDCQVVDRNGDAVVQSKAAAGSSSFVLFKTKKEENSAKG